MRCENVVESWKIWRVCFCGGRGHDAPNFVFAIVVASEVFARSADVCITSSLSLRVATSISTLSAGVAKVRDRGGPESPHPEVSTGCRLHVGLLVETMSTSDAVWEA